MQTKRLSMRRIQRLISPVLNQINAASGNPPVSRRHRDLVGIRPVSTHFHSRHSWSNRHRRMMGSSVACPRNHFYRTMERIVAGCPTAAVFLVVRTQGNHCCDLAD